MAVPVVSVNKGDVLTISLNATGSSWWSADNFQLTLVKADPTAIDPPTPFRGSNGQWPMVNGQSIYDLSGRLISSEANSSYSTLRTPLKKGLYIINRKKVMIK